MNINSVSSVPNMHFGAWRRDQYSKILSKISDEIKDIGSEPSEDMPVVKYFHWLDENTYGSDLYIDKNLRIHDGADKIPYCPKADDYSIAPLCEAITKLFKHLQGRGVNSMEKAGLIEEGEYDEDLDCFDDKSKLPPIPSFRNQTVNSSRYGIQRFLGDNDYFLDIYGDSGNDNVSPEVKAIRNRYGC